ncbi:hypothetical protein EI555_001447, partial [Monodon monoceros]
RASGTHQLSPQIFRGSQTYVWGVSYSDSLSNLSRTAGVNQNSFVPEVSERDFLPAPDGTTAKFVIRCVIPSLYLLIITVGLLGNIMLVKIFITNSAMRSVPSIFISNLAVGDMLLLITCVPWVFGKVGCKLIRVIQLTSVGMYVFTVTALSAHRYRATVNPMDIQTSGAVLWTCVKAVGIWVVSVLLAVPGAVFSQVAHIGGLDNVSFTACIPYPQTDELHPKIHSVLLFLVYFLILLAIINGNTETPGQNCADLFVCCFVFCWFPNHILYMYRSFNYNEIDPSLGHMIVTLVARVLSFCSSCVNPFTLYLLSESFRRHFNSQLCCGRKSY